MDSSIGILFLGGAKRVSMARKFKAAAKRRGLEARLYSYEMTREVPVAAEAEIITGLRWKDPAVTAHIVGLCRERGITAVVPFVDGAVAVAAAVSAAAPGIFAPTGSAADAEAMFDKVSAAVRFEALGLPVPQTYVPGTPLTFPVIAKPRHGSASKGIVAIDTDAQLRAFLEEHAADYYLFQHRLDRRREISADCYVSAAGNIVAAVPRYRDEVSGGEVSRTTLFHNDAVEALLRRVLTATGLRGAVTIQLIEDLDSHTLYIMEINPRLGGGAVAGVCAGADLPGFIIDEAMGRPLPATAAKWADGTVCRYPDEIFFKH